MWFGGYGPLLVRLLFFACLIFDPAVLGFQEGMVCVCVRVEITRMLCASEECENGVERDQGAVIVRKGA